MEHLFPYQVVGYQWLAQKKLALLADEMGLGKSAQAITAADSINAERVLVLCPAAARVNWQREFEKFSIFARTFHVHRTRKDDIPKVCSVISSYDLSSYIPEDNRFDLLILDEAHFLKSVGAKRTAKVFGNSGLVRRCKRTWCLTGTPMPNNPSELWVMLYSFGATKLRYEAFIEAYCTYYEGPHGRVITGARSDKIAELKEIIRPHILRRQKEQVLKDLPPISFQSIVVERGEVDLEVQASFVNYIFPVNKMDELKALLKKEEKLLTTVAKGIGLCGSNTKGDMMLALEAMAKSVSTLRRYSGLQKVEAVGDLVDEELIFGQYEKIVIFAIHRDVIVGLQNRLQAHGPVTLYGNTDPKTRVKNIDRFQTNPKCRVFIGNILAAGTAINLTAAHQVLFIEQSWSPADNAQAAMRCHRIGQEFPVFVRFVGLADSIDEKIAMALKNKTKDIARIFDASEPLTLPPYKR